MIFLVTTQTGHQRLIGSQQESLSGGALQFYVRKKGALRLQCAIAAGCWKESEAISKTEAQQLIADGIQHDRATLAYLEGKLESLTDEPAQEPTPRASTAGQGASQNPQGQFQTRILGNSHAGQKISIKNGPYGIKICAQPQGGGKAIWVKIPDNFNPNTITLTEAETLVKAYKPQPWRSR